MRAVAKKLPGFARLGRLPIGPQVTNLPHTANAAGIKKGAAFGRPFLAR
jgi:hypothetical protein